MKAAPKPTPRDIAIRRAIDTNSIHAMRRAYVETRKPSPIEAATLAQIERERDAIMQHRSGRE